MNFPTITIPDPAAVGAWLDEQVPQCNGWTHGVHYRHGAYSTMHWITPGSYVDAQATSPENLLANLRANLAALDPLAKLRKEAEQHGYELTPKAP